MLLRHVRAGEKLGSQFPLQNLRGDWYGCLALNLIDGQVTKRMGHVRKYRNTLCLSPQILHKHCIQFLFGLTMVQRENKNNAYAKFGGRNKEYRWFSPDVIAAMFVYRTIEKKVFREFDSIIMQNMSHNLLLFCTQTWPSHHVIENHLLWYFLMWPMLISKAFNAGLLLVVDYCNLEKSIPGHGPNMPACS